MGANMTNKISAAVLLLCGVAFSSKTLLAQNSATQTAQPVSARGEAPSIDQEIAMLRSDLRSTRKKVVAANMQLTDSESEKFWPTYEQYVSELVKINDAKYALVKEYLQNTNMTDEQADSLSKRWIEVDASVA